jgi:hypothetical protein
MQKTKIIVALLGVVAASASVSADDNARQFARWESDGFSYLCTIEKSEDGKCYVRYSDGTEEWVAHWRVGPYNVHVGDDVQADWENKGLYYSGTVTSRDGDRIHIQYDDGDEEDTSLARIRLKLAAPDGKEVDCRVFGRWASDGYLYPGAIKDIKDGKYLVHFDDSDEAWLESGEVVNYAPTWDDHVEANWLGKGTYYPGKVTRRKGEKVHIAYDDGDDEDTTISALRADYDGKFKSNK